MAQQFVSIPVSNMGPQFSPGRVKSTAEYGYQYVGVGGAKGLKGGGFSWPGGDQGYTPTPPPDLSDIIKTNQGRANIPMSQDEGRGDQFKAGQGDMEEHATSPIKAAGGEAAGGEGLGALADVAAAL